MKKINKIDEILTAEQAANMKSIWTCENKDGRFIIDRTVDGGLFLVDCALINPDDEEDMSHIFSFDPEDADEFLDLMKRAVIQNEAQKMMQQQ